MGSVVKALWWQLPDEMSVSGDVRGGSGSSRRAMPREEPVPRRGSGPRAVLGTGSPPGQDVAGVEAVVGLVSHVKTCW